MSFVHDVVELVATQGQALIGKAEHWARVPLGTIARVVNGYPFESAWFNGEQGQPVIRIRDVVPGKAMTFYSGPRVNAPLVEMNELVVGMDGDFNSRLWPSEPALLNQRVCKIIPDQRVYSNRLLAYVLPGYLKLINDYTSAITVKHLSSVTVQQLPIPLPPRNEQDRLVSKLDELFSRIEEGERALERVKKLVEYYRQSVLKAAVTGELTREWREKHKGKLESGEALLARILKARRAAWEKAELDKMKAKGQKPADDNWKRKYREPSLPDTIELPELPEGWVWASMDQVGIVSGGLTKNQKRDEHKLQRPYLRVANVYTNRLDLSEVHQIGVSESELNRVLLNKGDVLVVEGNGSIGQIGRVALWDGSIEGCVHQNHLIKVRCTEVLPPWYILVWCMSSLGREQIRGVASSTAGLHTLSISKVQALPVPIPNAAELATILDRFEQMDSLVVNQREAIRKETCKSASLRQSVLRAAFSGVLVPQDPADEQASVLLERIAAERTKTNAATTKRSRKRRQPA